MLPARNGAYHRRRWAAAVVMLLILVAVADVEGQDVTADCSWEPEDELEQLTCHLKTLQAGPAVLPQVGKARVLRLVCSDLYLYESLVRPDQFGRLPHLTALSLEYCKIRQLPASAFGSLRNLHSLSLRGHNSEWGASSLTLQLAADSLKGLDSLEVLDMSDNNIWGLPSGSLCHTPLLQSLNLSRNNIVEVSEVGLTDVLAASGNNNNNNYRECQLLHLVSLDLSYNRISSLLPRDLSLAPGLQKLSLRGNRLSILSEQSLTGLWSLAMLDLADNQLAALPSAGLFHAAANLQELSLQNNSLAALGPDTLAGLNSLLLLNLSRNALTSAQLSERAFRHLPKLVALDLSHNRLSRLPDGLLVHQQGLQILNLQHNAIVSLEAASLASLVNLHILLLSHNQLENLPDGCFASLASLSSLSLDHNQLIDLPEGQLATGTPALIDLALNNNQLVAVPADVGRLTRLRTLDLGENTIEVVADSQLENLTSLYGLRLAGNRIERISAEVFANATNLHVLNLAHNRLASIDQAAFKNLKNLRALRLDNNQLKDINGLVSSQKNLRWLNVSANNLQWFDFAFIPKSLEWLDIHNNNVDRIGNYYGLSSGFSLTTFDASFNQIREIEGESLLASLRNIYLNNNRIGRIAAHSFRLLGNLSRVELQSNEIASLEMTALVTATSTPSGLAEFLLGGNPLLCDCRLEWLKSINQLATTAGGYPRIMDLDALLCQLNGRSLPSPPPAVSSAPANNSLTELVPLVQVRTEEFMCAYEAHCIPQCFCCDFFACDCRMQCPEGCTCYHDNAWTNNIIQCTGRGHNDVPPLIPMDATSVYLDGNNMTELVNPGFIGRRRVHSVYLNNSLIRTITNYSFEGLTELRVLHLEDNQIEQLVGNEFSTGLEQLKELYLQNNYLTSIAGETFRGLAGLAILRLDGNLLTTLPAWELFNNNNNPLLVGLYMGANMWSCDCDFLAPFRAFVSLLGDRLIDRVQLRCVADHYRAGEALTHLDHVACAQEDDDSLAVQSSAATSSSMHSLDYTPILVSVLLAVLLIVVGYLVAFTFRKSIQTLLCRGKLAANDGSKLTGGGGLGCGGNDSFSNGKEKLFDVFISYALEDRDFVEQTFAATLEHGATSYRLCLHQRDFPPTTPVYDTVAVAVESSARALIVLSRSYLAHQWDQIRLPFLESITVNNTKLVFVQLEEEENEAAAFDSCPELRHLVEDSPLLHWNDPGFWNKLRHFLPEPVYLTFHRNVTMRGTLQSSCNLYQPVLGNGRTAVTTGGENILLCATTAGGGDCEEGEGKCEQPYCPSTTYSSSEHTYHSIDNAHIYHTLDPGSTPSLYQLHNNNSQQFVQQMLPGRVYINNSINHVGGKQAPAQLIGNNQLLTRMAVIPKQQQQHQWPAVATILPHNSNGGSLHHLRQQQQQQFGQPAICHSGPVAPQPAVHHAHTNSTSSGKRLLSGEDSEYIV